MVVDQPDNVGGGAEMPPEGESDMELADQAMQQNLVQLGQTAVVAQNNFVTVQKVVDYDYLENKRMVTLDEAIGVREVQAEKSPGGPSKPS